MWFLLFVYLLALQIFLIFLIFLIEEIFLILCLRMIFLLDVIFHLWISLLKFRSVAFLFFLVIFFRLILDLFLKLKWFCQLIFLVKNSLNKGKTSFVEPSAEVAQNQLHQVDIEVWVLKRKEKPDVKVANQGEVLDFFNLKVGNVAQASILLAETLIVHFTSHLVVAFLDCFSKILVLLVQFLYHELSGPDQIGYEKLL